MKDPKKVAMGKKSRAAGMRFEKKVRLDLEKKKWIINRWMNNVELESTMTGEGKKLINLMPGADHKLIPAKAGRFRSTTTGFPDFMCFKILTNDKGENLMLELNFDDKRDFAYQVIGIECKMNGYLDIEEKAKCKWYLQNNIFSRILIARKAYKKMDKKNGKKSRDIIYEEFKC